MTLLRALKMLLCIPAHFLIWILVSCISLFVVRGMSAFHIMRDITSAQETVLFLYAACATLFLLLIPAQMIYLVCFKSKGSTFSCALTYAVPVYALIFQPFRPCKDKLFTLNPFRVFPLTINVCYLPKAHAFLLPVFWCIMILMITIIAKFSSKSCDIPKSDDMLRP